VILHRCLAWDRRAAASAPGGALWFPRELQGEGRHDAPELYGCVYVSEAPVAAVVEELARFAGTALRASDLRRGGLPLALAELRLADGAALVDLDAPLVLAAEGLRPSLVTTATRARTQAHAIALHARRPNAAGIRWPSTFEPLWANVTLFDRALDRLSVEDVRPLRPDDPVLGEAAAFLGLRVAA
jgi:RES domain